MHSLSKELLNTKIIHLRNAGIMQRKVDKLWSLKRDALIQVACEVRMELNRPWITDVLTSDVVSKMDLIQDIMTVISSSVKNNLSTVLSHGR